MADGVLGLLGLHVVGRVGMVRGNEQEAVTIQGLVEYLVAESRNKKKIAKLKNAVSHDFNTDSMD